jgi:hypothetical protein
MLATHRYDTISFVQSAHLFLYCNVSELVFERLEKPGPGGFFFLGLLRFC